MRSVERAFKNIWQIKLLISLITGFFIMTALFLNLDAVELPFILNILATPVSWLVSFVPLHNIGTPENPIYEGTPIHAVAASLGILLCFPFYAALTYSFLSAIDFIYLKFKY